MPERVYVIFIHLSRGITEIHFELVHIFYVVFVFDGRLCVTPNIYSQ